MAILYYRQADFSPAEKCKHLLIHDESIIRIRYGDKWWQFDVIKVLAARNITYVHIGNRWMRKYQRISFADLAQQDLLMCEERRFAESSRVSPEVNYANISKEDLAIKK